MGVLWKPKLWAINAVIFYGFFTVFLHTSVFTNGQGFFTGMVGSLGYWLSQQSVNRGTQPWYYYSFLQIPMYEYLAALGTILGFIIGISCRLIIKLATNNFSGIKPKKSQKPFNLIYLFLPKMGLAMGIKKTDCLY